jgi:hypothetical protein
MLSLLGLLQIIQRLLLLHNVNAGSGMLISCDRQLMWLLRHSVPVHIRYFYRHGISTHYRLHVRSASTRIRALVAGPRSFSSSQGELLKLLLHQRLLLLQRRSLFVEVELALSAERIAIVVLSSVLGARKDSLPMRHWYQR